MVPAQLRLGEIMPVFSVLLQLKDVAGRCISRNRVG